MVVSTDGVKEISIFNIHDKFWENAEETVKKINERTNCKATLYDLDDKEKLKKPITVTENGKSVKLTTVGEKWSFLQRHKFGANAQPYYVIINSDGEPLAAPYGYNESVPKFIDFLQKGLKAFNK